MLRWRGFYLFAEGRGIVGVISSPKDQAEFEQEFEGKQYRADPRSGMQILTDSLEDARAFVENHCKVNAT